jgi:hypothetical protein
VPITPSAKVMEPLAPALFTVVVLRASTTATLTSDFKPAPPMRLTAG